MTNLGNGIYFYSKKCLNNNLDEYAKKIDILSLAEKERKNDS